MRTIKFRAWDKKARQMARVMSLTQMEQTPLTLIKYGTELDEKAWAIPSEQLEVMQFTGLLDKNGKEIYEGDIVRHTFISGDQEVGRIVWNEGSARFVWYARDAGDGYGMQRKDDGDREVLGNIHENPELLK